MLWSLQEYITQRKGLTCSATAYKWKVTELDPPFTMSEGTLGRPSSAPIAPAGQRAMEAAKRAATQALLDEAERAARLDAYTIYYLYLSHVAFAFPFP